MKFSSPKSEPSLYNSYTNINISLTAVRPRQLVVGADEGGPHVDERVRHDDVVVDADDEREDDHGEAHALGDGGAAPKLNWTSPIVHIKARMSIV